MSENTWKLNKTKTNHKYAFWSNSDTKNAPQWLLETTETRTKNKKKHQNTNSKKGRDAPTRPTTPGSLRGREAKGREGKGLPFRHQFRFIRFRCRLIWCKDDFDIVRFRDENPMSHADQSADQVILSFYQAFTYLRLPPSPMTLPICVSACFCVSLCVFAVFTTFIGLNQGSS